MGQLPFPRQDKLRFIIQRIIDGSSDADIQQALEDYGPLGRVKPGEYGVYGETGRRTIANIRHVVQLTQEQVRGDKKVDPVLAEGRKKHYEEVEDTIRRQKEDLGVPSPQYAPFPSGLDSGLDWLPVNTSYRGVLPFRNLETHLPEALWAEFEQRDAKYSSYLESCSQLLKEIEDESEKRTGLRIDRSTAQRNEPCLTPRFSQLIYGDICERASGSPLGMLGNNPDYELVSRPSGERELWLSSSCITEGSPSGIEYSRMVHEEMLRQYRVSGKAERLVQLYEELTKLTETIRAELEHILLSRSYIKGMCGFCNGL